MAVEAIKMEGAFAFGLVTVRGKIVRKRRHDGKSYTAIICPALDEYSKPQTVEVRSAASVGDVGDIVNVRAQLGGYERKQYQAVDKNTGEVTRITPVDMTLDAVEG